MATNRSFRVGITRDMLKPDGSLAFGDVGLELLDQAPGVEYAFLDRHTPEFLPEHAAEFDAVISVGPRYPAASLADPSCRLLLVARFGVGYDHIDVPTLNAAGVCVSCLLNAETRGLIGARELGLMKPSAYLINIARGPIVDEKALYRVLADSRIAGAGLDVFATEPTPPDNPILKLDNVIVAPHALAWTDELFSSIGVSAIESVLAVARGTVPHYRVNREVLSHPRLQQHLAALAGR